MKNPTAVTGGSFESKSKSREFNPCEDKTFPQPSKNYKPFSNELHLEIYPLEQVIEIAITQWHYLKDKTLPQTQKYFNHRKEKGDSAFRLAQLYERCERLEYAINLQLWLITLLQKFLPEIIKLDSAEKQAKEQWGEMPDKYVLTFLYEKTKKMVAVIEKR